jgi:predicted DNA binding protein
MQGKIIRMRTVVIVACALILGIAVYLTASPVICDITPRSYANMVIADTVEMRKQIAKIISAEEMISDTGKFSVLAGKGAMLIDFGLVTEKGSIVIYNKQYGVVVVQEPVISGKEVMWNFILYPDNLDIKIRQFQNVKNNSDNDK